MKIADLLELKSINADISSSGKMDVLSELSGLLAASCNEINAEQATRILLERERLATTGIGDGVAIPHGKVNNLDSIYAAVGISKTGIPFDAVDGRPVHIFVALLAPQGSTGDHLKALARISRLLKDPSFRENLLTAQTSEDVYKALLEEDGKY